MKETKNFIATWPELGMSVECEPRENGINKWIYDWYIEHMPIKYLQLHASVCGKVIYTWTRVSETLPEQGDNVLVKTKDQDVAVGFGHMSFNVPNGLVSGHTAHIAFSYWETRIWTVITVLYSHKHSFSKRQGCHKRLVPRNEHNIRSYPDRIRRAAY